PDQEPSASASASGRYACAASRRRRSSSLKAGWSRGASTWSSRRRMAMRAGIPSPARGLAGRPVGLTLAPALCLRPHLPRRDGGGALFAALTQELGKAPVFLLQALDALGELAQRLDRQRLEALRAEKFHAR